MIKEQIVIAYLPIILLVLTAFFLGFVIIILPFLFSKRYSYKAKNSQYECGFKGFKSIRRQFDVRFYLISILFIVFDMEIAFLFPWANLAKNLGITGLLSVMCFLAFLAVGFIYEWKKGALDM